MCTGAASTRLSVFNLHTQSGRKHRKIVFDYKVVVFDCTVARPLQKANFPYKMLTVSIFQQTGFRPLFACTKNLGAPVQAIRHELGSRSRAPRAALGCAGAASLRHGLAPWSNRQNRWGRVGAQHSKEQRACPDCCWVTRKRDAVRRIARTQQLPAEQAAKAAVPYQWLGKKIKENSKTRTFLNPFYN